MVSDVKALEKIAERAGSSGAANAARMSAHGRSAMPSDAKYFLLPT